MRRQEYRDSKIELKRIVRESKSKVDEDFGLKSSRKLKENQKLFWREERKGSGGQMYEGERVNDKNGDLLKDKDKVRER